MSTPQFTPGPWRVSESGHIIAADDRKTVIANVGNVYNESVAADARLIAAAPDLLSALKRVLAGFESNAFQRNTDGDFDPAWTIKFMPHLLALADATKAIDKAEGIESATGAPEDGK